MTLPVCQAKESGKENISHQGNPMREENQELLNFVATTKTQFDCVSDDMCFKPGLKPLYAKYVYSFGEEKGWFGHKFGVKDVRRKKCLQNNIRKKTLKILLLK